MRKLSIDLEPRFHASTAALLATLQALYGADEVEVNNVQSVARPDLPGIAYAYTGATDAEEAHLAMLLSALPLVDEDEAQQAEFAAQAEWQKTWD